MAELKGGGGEGGHARAPSARPGIGRLFNDGVRFEVLTLHDLEDDNRPLKVHDAVFHASSALDAHAAIAPDPHTHSHVTTREAYQQHAHVHDSLNNMQARARELVDEIRRLRKLPGMQGKVLERERELRATRLQIEG